MKNWLDSIELPSSKSNLLNRHIVDFHSIPSAEIVSVRVESTIWRVAQTHVPVLHDRMLGIRIEATASVIPMAHDQSESITMMSALIQRMPYAVRGRSVFDFVQDLTSEVEPEAQFEKCDDEFQITIPDGDDYGRRMMRIYAALEMELTGRERHIVRPAVYPDEESDALALPAGTIP